MRPVLLLALLIGLLTGCAAADVSQPIGTGNGMDELPVSPCACDVFYRSGQWLG